MMDRNFEKILAGLKYNNLKLKNPRDDYETRLLIQKYTYICQSLGIDLNKYKFSLYLNGPYCSVLADDYYLYSDSVPTLNVSYQTTRGEIKVFEKIKEHIIDHPKFENYRAALLEATSTIMLLSETHPDFSDDEIFSKTKDIKPHLKDSMIVIAIDIVKKLKFKPESVPQDFKDEMKMWENADD
ncbi:MAG: hypothetical protein ACFFCS_15145 [Candidatus Hodarchaeota archaeon]